MVYHPEQDGTKSQSTVLLGVPVALRSVWVLWLRGFRIVIVKDVHEHDVS